MKKFIKDCENCEGWGYNLYNDDFEQNPIYDRRTECTLCEEGKVLDSELIQDSIFDVEDLILGMKTRIELYQNLAEKCELGYLDNLAAKFKKRVDTCKRGLLRLAQYKLKLENL
jgi:hypothetical protein